LGNGRGCVLLEGEIKVSYKITLRRVALVQSLGYNLLSVSQLLDEGFEVLSWSGGSRILDYRGDLVCMVVPEDQVFRADFSQSSGVERCFLAGSSSELWKWHRKLGHLSFNLLSRLSKPNLVRGLPRLRVEKELVCAPCRHAKMVASSHPPLTNVMTERPCELLHMDLVGQLVCDLRVGSSMSLLWWMTTLGMHGCSFLRIRGGIWFCSGSCLEVE
jgi:hypothetical protein